MHDEAQNGMGRTSNEIESWHAAFATKLGASHPQFGVLLEHLRVEQGRTDFIVSDSRAQGKTSAPKKKYRDRNARLQELVNSYADRTTMQFLMSCAHSIRFQIN